MQRRNGVFLQVYVWEDREVPRPQFMLANRSGDYCLTADERRAEPCHGSTLARSPRRVCGQIAICGPNAICEQFRGMGERKKEAPGVPGAFVVDSRQSLCKMDSRRRISM